MRFLFGAITAECQVAQELVAQIECVEMADGVFAVAVVSLVVGAGGMKMPVSSVDVEIGEGFVRGTFGPKEVVCFEGDTSVVVNELLSQTCEVGLATSAFKRFEVVGFFELAIITKCTVL